MLKCSLRHAESLGASDIVPSLKPGASVVLVERDPDKGLSGSRNHRRSYDPSRHDFMPSRVVLKRIEEAGYSIVKTEISSKGILST